MLGFAIVLLNWNNAPDTLECLASIEKIDYPNFEVIVVDNGSTDGSVSLLRAAYPDLILIETGENTGFAEGNNRGLLEAKKRGADLIFLLNNDTVVAPNILQELAKAAKEHPEAGVFGAKIYFYDEPATIWYAGGGVDPKTGRCYHVGCGFPDTKEKYKVPKETEYACGCALFVRAEVLESVGLLDPDFFLIWEEIDWCWRIRKAGYRCLFVPRARVWHKISASFPEGNRGPIWNYFYYRNQLLFHKRHMKKLPLKELAPLLAKIHKKEFQAGLFGILDYFLGRFGKGRLSKFIQN